jgi:hypothetical protein
MKDKTGRPERKLAQLNNYYDLEKRGIYIPNNFITSRMVSPSVLVPENGTAVGRYGITKYGRCVYGPAGPIGIYGTDTYGNCVYG